MAADLVLYLNLDTANPSLRRVRSLNELMPVGMDPLTGGSTVAIEIRPHRSGTVATDFTASGNKPRLVLKVKGPTGDVELARMNPADFTVITESSVVAGWTGTLSLNAAAMRAYFADGAEAKLANLEVTLVTAAGLLKPLYLVSAALLAGYLADSTESEDSAAPIVRSDVTTYALARSLSTAGRAKPAIFLFLIGGTWETWTLRAQAASGEDDDGALYLVPSDYNVSTNKVVFVKSALT